MGCYTHYSTYQEKSQTLTYQCIPLFEVLFLDVVGAVDSLPIYPSTHPGVVLGFPLNHHNKPLILILVILISFYF